MPHDDRQDDLAALRDLLGFLPLPVAAGAWFLANTLLNREEFRHAPDDAFAAGRGGF